MQVRLGEHNIAVNEGTRQFLHFAKVNRHAGYASRIIVNDILLIRLASPATLVFYVKTVSLPTGCASIGTTCLISRWGNTLSSGTNMPILLQCLNESILTNTQPSQIISNMIRVGYLEGGMDSCQEYHFFNFTIRTKLYY
ncbi:unnamed protein product [Staurois parvus]|uniref:Peptidase S1 domain-containing protein n=1 Tax=Staurois parvus TaxID=386267 RepID=A0ABN9E1W2_9NEOB|nr:unnamed protein product [Staurois parvus]